MNFSERPQSAVRATLDKLTPEQLALLVSKLAKKNHQAAGKTDLTLQRFPRSGSIPLSHAQERLWVLNQVGQAGAHYNLSRAELRGELDIAVMEEAFSELVRRHEVLQTVFKMDGSKAVQVIQPFAAYTIPVIDVGGLDPRDQAEEIQRLLATEAAMPFDLTQGPLIRLKIFRLSRTEHVVACTLHHIIADGWSLEVLMRDFQMSYRAVQNGTKHSLSELPVQYADYAIWQRRWLESGEMQKQLSFWKSELEGTRFVLNLPISRPRPVVCTFVGGAWTFRLGRDLSARLRALGKEFAASHFMVLLAGFAAFLSRYSGQVDFLIGTPISNRKHPDLLEVVGFFANTIVIRADLSARPAFGEFLRQIRKRVLDAFTNEDLPFERLVQELNPPREPNRNPLFQVLFTLDTGPLATLSNPDAGARALPMDAGMVKFDLSLHMVDNKEEFVGLFKYAKDIFDEPTVRNIQAKLVQLIYEICSDPHRPIFEHSMLSGPESSLQKEIDQIELDI